MSRDTCRRLLELGYKTDKEEHELTTLDLELMKMKTGIEVGGDCEMRMVWKYNELKPRFYYCQGGTAYWPSRFTVPAGVSRRGMCREDRADRRVGRGMRNKPSTIQEVSPRP